jgi:hypothetical protein
MCDLWQHTTEGDTPRGAIPAQIAAARRTLENSSPPVSGMKLYNAGSFFDPRAIPDADYDEIAVFLTHLTHVIVESHPSLIGARTSRFLTALESTRGLAAAAPSLEVAMGLETAHPDALERLHKRMTVDGFRLAADELRALGVALRVFLLVSPPFVPHAEQDDWLLRSLDVALAAGATTISIIPTRTGNGALEALAALAPVAPAVNEAWFRQPTLSDLERSLALAQAHACGSGARIFADLWDLGRFAACAHCLDARRGRLHAMNLEQRVLPPPPCPECQEQFAV